MKRPTTFRGFSAKEDFQVIPPGPMAQAFTFRAFGAENSSENWFVAGEVIESIGRRGSLNPGTSTVSPAGSTELPGLLFHLPQVLS